MQGDFSDNPFVRQRRNPLGDIDALQDDDLLSNRPFYGQGLPGQRHMRGGGGGMRVLGAIPRINQFSVPATAEKALVGSQTQDTPDNVYSQPQVDQPDVTPDNETGYGEDVFARSAAKTFPTLQPAGGDNSAFLARQDTQPTSTIDQGEDTYLQARSAAQSDVDRLYKQYQDTISDVGKGSPFLKAMSRMYLGYDPDASKIEKANAVMAQYNMARERLAQYMPGQEQIDRVQSGNYVSGINHRTGEVVWSQQIAPADAAKTNAPHTGFTTDQYGNKLIMSDAEAHYVRNMNESAPVVGPDSQPDEADSFHPPVIDAAQMNREKTQDLSERRINLQSANAGAAKARDDYNAGVDTAKAEQVQIDKARTAYGKLMTDYRDPVKGMTPDQLADGMATLRKTFGDAVFNKAITGQYAARPTPPGAAAKPAQTTETPAPTQKKYPWQKG